MLGYILSKMQMLLFAAGILFVAVLFLGFISNLELKTTADNLLLNTSSGIISVLSSKEGLCHSTSLSIPDRLSFGFNGSSQVFYDLSISWVTINDKNELILSINEHDKKNVISARKVSMAESIVLVDPGFLPELDVGLNNYYDKQKIVLYPRAANKGVQSSAPNSFYIIKEVKGGQGTIYIIPCTTLHDETPNNCVRNVLRVGCHKLAATNPNSSDSIDQCFDITREISDSGTQVSGMTWAQCISEGYYYNSP